MNNEKINEKNKFELEGNVANISDILINKNGKVTLKFDLGQNNGENTQFIPIALKGGLVKSYGNQIKKGDWILVKGKINSYLKDVERDGKLFKDKVIEILGFEVTDKVAHKVYTSDGQIKDLDVNKEEKER